MFRVLTYLLFASLSISCAKQIDGENQESYKASLEEIKKGLNEDEIAKFEDALQKVAFEDVENLSDIAKIDIDEIRDKLDGMTYDDVIAEGERIQKVIDERNKEHGRIEIEELYEKMDSSSEDSIALSKFKVEKSRYYKRKDYIGYEPVIDLTVINRTKHPVSRAYFTGTIRSPERTIPWLVKDFNYEISGGLEPGERANWVLGPNKYSEWGTVKPPKDAIFTVVVTKLDGANGEKLFSIDFDEEDKERLEELLKDYPEFKQ